MVSYDYPIPHDHGIKALRKMGPVRCQIVTQQICVGTRTVTWDEGLHARLQWYYGAVTNFEDGLFDLIKDLSHLDTLLT